MTRDFVIKNISDYNYIIRSIEEANKELEVLADSITACRNISAISYKDTGVSSNTINDSVFNAAQRVEKLSESMKHWNNRLDSLNAKRLMIASWFDLLDSCERDVMTYRYVKNMRWQMLSRLTIYNERHCRRLGNIAIDKILDAIEKDSRLCPNICGTVLM